MNQLRFWWDKLSAFWCLDSYRPELWGLAVLRERQSPSGQETGAPAGVRPWQRPPSPGLPLRSDSFLCCCFCCILHNPQRDRGASIVKGVICDRWELGWSNVKELQIVSALSWDWLWIWVLQEVSIILQWNLFYLFVFTCVELPFDAVLSPIPA